MYIRSILVGHLDNVPYYSVTHIFVLVVLSCIKSYESAEQRLPGKDALREIDRQSGVVTLRRNPLLVLFFFLLLCYVVSNNNSATTKWRIFSLKIFLLLQTFLLFTRECGLFSTTKHAIILLGVLIILNNFFFYFVVLYPRAAAYYYIQKIK